MNWVGEYDVSMGVFDVEHSSVFVGPAEEASPVVKVSDVIAVEGTVVDFSVDILSAEDVVTSGVNVVISGAGVGITKVSGTRIIRNFSRSGLAP